MTSIDGDQVQYMYMSEDMILMKRNKIQRLSRVAQRWKIEVSKSPAKCWSVRHRRADG